VELPVLDLTAGGLERVGLDEGDLLSNDWNGCQLVGQAAHFLGAGGLVANSATKKGLTIAVFETRVHGELKIVGEEQIRADELREPNSE
jgi:RES domain-containing protein